MKNLKLSFLLVCTLLLTFSSCSKDDDPLKGKSNEEITALIVGKWQLSHMAGWVKDSTTGMKIELDTNTALIMKMTFFFDDEGDGYRIAEDDYEEFTWSLNSRKLLLKDSSNDSESLDLINVTSDQLVLFVKESIDGLTGELTLTFKKVK